VTVYAIYLEYMALKKGDRAPDFIVQDIDGKTIKLSDYKNKKLLLCFFRYAGCPFCNLILHSFVERYPKLHDNGLDILAFIQSPKESIIEYPAKKQQPRPPFPLIPDPKRHVYNQYGVELSLKGLVKGGFKIPKMVTSLYKHRFPQGKIDGKFLLMPAFFLIGPKDFKIYDAYYSPDFATMIPDIDILNFIALS
jgi:peroxiredoxin Q/BCP